jgi:hypothetical protein
MIMKIKTYFLLCLLLVPGGLIDAQEAPAEEAPAQEEPVEPVMEMTYLKDTDGKINLSSSMVNYVNRMPVPLPGLEIEFYAGEDSLVRLGSAATDAEGHALLVLEGDTDLPAGEDRSVRYFAEFKGNDNILPAEFEVYITDVNLEMSLDMVDSVRTISLRAYTLVDGEEVPVPDEDVYVYVKRMFNDLPVAEDFLDENGEYVTVLPDDIPGNAEGDIEVIARFNEHYMFGTVEKRQIIPWGVPTQYDFAVTQRTLWTQIAPLWMIITLSILLTGVWGHYIYVVAQLFRLRRIARKEGPTSLV